MSTGKQELSPQDLSEYYIINVRRTSNWEIKKDMFKERSLDPVW